MKGEERVFAKAEKLLRAVNCESLSLLCSPHPNESRSTPPAKTFGASDRESRYKARAPEWLSSLAGVIRPALQGCMQAGWGFNAEDYSGRADKIDNGKVSSSLA